MCVPIHNDDKNHYCTAITATATTATTASTTVSRPNSLCSVYCMVFTTSETGMAGHIHQ